MDSSAVKTPEYVDTDPWTDAILLQGEKETLGFYLTGHPLDQYAKELKNFTTCRIAELHPSEHSNARMAGIITNLRTRQTKRGDRIAIFSLDDGTGQIEVVCFSEPYQTFRPLLVEDQLIIVEGEVGIDDFSNSARILAREISTLEQNRTRLVKCIQVTWPESLKLDHQHLALLLKQHTGNCPVVIRYQANESNTDIRLGKDWMVKPCEEFLMKLQEQYKEVDVEMIY